MNKFTSFCWIRVLPVGQPASDPAARVVVEVTKTQKAEVPSARLSSYDGGRPPLAMLPLDGGRPPLAKLQLDGGRPPQAVMSLPDQLSSTQIELRRFWSADRDHFGNVQAGTVFDFGPAFDRQQAAVDWISTREGEVWAQQSMNYVLLAVGEANALRFPERGPSWEHDNSEATPDKYLFPNSDWSLAAGSLHEPARPLPSLLLKSLDDPGLRCASIDHDSTADECAQLVALQNDRTEDQEHLIRRQAQSQNHAIFDVLATASIDHALFAGPDGRELISLVVDTAQAVVFINKRRFMRARPKHLCEALQPMFPKSEVFTDRLFPGHPSYPSSHATMAYVWAYLLQRCGADPKGLLISVAQQIGKNREIAGVHFSSDTLAGQKLAKEIVKKMLDERTNGNFDWLVSRLMRLGLQPPK